MTEPVPSVKIHIGQLHVSRSPVEINTLLGSCVSVCLYDPVVQIGGMNHILLPGKADLDHFDRSARYGINAMEILINRLLKEGAQRRNLRAKVFGGAHILRSVEEFHSPGSRNLQFVFRFLEIEQFPVVNMDIGGHNARKVFFRTDNGDVRLKKVPAVYFGLLRRAEQRFTRRIRYELGSDGRVSMFQDG